LIDNAEAYKGLLSWCGIDKTNLLLYGVKVRMKSCEDVRLRKHELLRIHVEDTNHGGTATRTHSFARLRIMNLIKEMTSSIVIVSSLQDDELHSLRMQGSSFIDKRATPHSAIWNASVSNAVDINQIKALNLVLEFNTAL
jgi:hypothetical protein